MANREYTMARLFHLARTHRIVGVGLLLLGAFLILMVNSDRSSDSDDRVAMDFLGAVVILLGVLSLAMSAKLPTTEIMRLALSRNGLLTLSEIVTTLDVDPARALRALHKLEKVGIASKRWQEIYKNIWEFPDYIQLPIDETLTLAQKSGGRVSLKDLVASGHSLTIAEQTFDALAEKGLGQQDPTATGRTLIMESH